MIILSIDTATEACSVAIQVNKTVFSRFEICPQQHSQKVFLMLQEVLAEADVRLSNIDAIAVSQGPGSFTGVRIGISVVQGLALGANKPVIPISTLATLAQQADTQKIAVAIDARMNEVYYAQYERRDGLVYLSDKEQVIAPVQAAGHCEDFVPDAIAGTGWSAYEPLQQLATNMTHEISYPNAAFMLPLAIDRLNNHAALNIEELAPVYVRDTVTWKKLPGR